QPHHQGHDAPAQPVAGADTTVGGGHNQTTEGHADQPRHQGHDGPASPGAGADTTGGAQSPPTEDHAGQSHQRGHRGPETPGSPGELVGKTGAAGWRWPAAAAGEQPILMAMDTAQSAATSQFDMVSPLSESWTGSCGPTVVPPLATHSAGGGGLGIG